MKKILLAVLFLVMSCQLFAGDRYSRYRTVRGKWRNYTTALTLNSPLSATYKLGGGIERRFRNTSYMASYWKYTGAYPGAQENLEIRRYLPAYSNFQWFIYTRFVFGITAYDGTKLKMFGYDHDIYMGDYAYIGAGGGFGRRFNYDMFFFAFKVGAKYCQILDDLSQEDKNMFRLFYATGPGSIVDVNFQFGIQL